PTSDYTELISLHVRALPNAPDSYAPKAVQCPPIRPSVRSSARVSDEEAKWLVKRKEHTEPALHKFLKRVSIDGFDADQWLKSHKEKDASAVPNVAIAASGGGYRAMLNGAGAIAAFDERTPNSTAEGHLGGLLQASTYVSGLSGGSWLVGSVFLNNFTAIHDLQKSESVWDLSRSILKGPTDHSFFLLKFKDNIEYLYHLRKQIETKKHANFSLALTDL
ncbi:Lysophospholipase 1, partial [Ascosphaera aggregata]